MPHVVLWVAIDIRMQLSPRVDRNKQQPCLLVDLHILGASLAGKPTTICAGRADGLVRLLVGMVADLIFPMAPRARFAVTLRIVRHRTREKVTPYLVISVRRSPPGKRGRSAPTD